jgi:hypothetical protein
VLSADKKVYRLSFFILTLQLQMVNTLNKEQQYLSLLIPSLSVMHTIISRLSKSNASVYKNTKLLRVLLTVSLVDLIDNIL